MSEQPRTKELGTAKGRNPMPTNELERVLKLNELNLDYSELKEILDDFSTLAAYVAGTEVSLINLIDTYTQWSVANYGIELDQMPREDSVCQYTILEDKELEITNLQQNDRFSSKPYVDSGPALTYYFGIPLTTANGQNIGALCVMDTETQELSPEEVELLKLIANQIVTRIESVHTINTLRQKLDRISEIPRKVLHDVRGPIGGIIGLSDIIKEEAEQKELDDILDLIKLIHEGGQSVMELANNYFDPNEDSSGEEDNDGLKGHLLNLPSLHDKLKQLFKPQAVSKGVNLDIKISKEHHDLSFSKQKLLQIAGNLISNAIKFTPEGGEVPVNLELKKKSSRDSKNSHLLKICVEDTGIGMDPEKIKEIQSNNMDRGTTTTEGTGGEQGFGFGIHLVKHLADSLNGELEISSQKGEGCNVEVSIPMKL